MNCRSPSGGVEAPVLRSVAWIPRVHAAGVEALPEGLPAIDLDVQVGPAAHAEIAEAGDDARFPAARDRFTKLLEMKWKRTPKPVFQRISEVTVECPGI
jgi:hypothetical protein